MSLTDCHISLNSLHTCWLISDKLITALRILEWDGLNLKEALTPIGKKKQKNRTIEQ